MKAKICQTCFWMICRSTEREKAEFLVFLEDWNGSGSEQTADALRPAVPRLPPGSVHRLRKVRRLGFFAGLPAGAKA